MYGLRLSFLVFICDLLIWTNGQSTSTCCPCLKEQSGDPIAKSSIGQKGEKGDRGSAGEPGYHGLKGLPGSRGRNGPRGMSGPEGSHGRMGEDGLKGEAGQKGDRGIPGLFGHKGGKGEAGLAGLHGFPGMKGEKGSCAIVNQGQDTNYVLNEYIAFANKSYWFSVLPLTWQKASKACNKLGADLVSVESYEEDTFLTTVNIELSKKYAGLWNSFFMSGFHKFTFDHMHRGYKWVWTRRGPDTSITYHRYAHAQDFDSIDRNKKCMLYSTGGAPLVGWTKTSCNSAHQFVCMKVRAR